MKTNNLVSPPRLIVTTMLLLLGFLLSTTSQANSHTTDDFVTEWQIPAGSNATRTLTFPGNGSYTINWGDGNAIEAITSNNRVFNPLQ